jgi:hypothetical protein
MWLQLQGRVEEEPVKAKPYTLPGFKATAAALTC